VIALHELAGEQATARLTLDEPDDAEALIDLFSDAEHPLAPKEPVELELRPYDHRWLRVRRAGRRLPP
jgi:hypothetical protein